MRWAGKLRAALRRLLTANARIRDALGEDVICRTCGATWATFPDLCRAPLAGDCPGIERIKNAEAT